MTNNKDLGKELFVSFFFLGKSPIAPGTFGSAGALILAYLINEYVADFAGFLLLILAAIMYYIGLQIAPWCEKNMVKIQASMLLMKLLDI